MSAKNTVFFEIAEEKKAFNDWLYGSEQEKISFAEHKKRCLMVAINEELSDVQRCYFLKYHVENWTIREISRFCGVNASTVARTLRSARNRLARVLRYSSPTLLNLKQYDRNRRNS